MVFSGFLFGLRSLLYRGDQNAILIIPHYSMLETDVQHLLRRLPQRTDREVIIATEDDSPFGQNPLNTQLVDAENVTTVTKHSTAFRSALLRSTVVILKGRHHLHSYRFFTVLNNRDYIVFDHGLITKAYARHKQTYVSGSVPSRIKRWLIDRYMYRNLTTQSVCSEVERFFRSSAERRHPSHFEEFGYPRFDRIDEFIQMDAEPLLESEIKSMLEEGTTNILYAPTHKDDAYPTTLFPFDDFDRAHLVEFLDENDAILYLRMHPREADHPQLDDLVDDDRIRKLGSSTSHSSVEILPYMDIVMTDYSSIYMDFLPFDRPMIFVHDRFEEYQQVRGLAFDHERYFPGKTVASFDEWVQHVQQIIDTDEDEYSDQREFVKRVLLPERSTSCSESILSRID